MKIKCAHKVDLDSKINKIVKDKVAQDMKSLLEDMEPIFDQASDGVIRMPIQKHIENAKISQKKMITDKAFFKNDTEIDDETDPSLKVSK